MGRLFLSWVCQISPCLKGSKKHIEFLGQTTFEIRLVMASVQMVKCASGKKATHFTMTSQWTGGQWDMQPLCSFSPWLVEELPSRRPEKTKTHRFHWINYLVPHFKVSQSLKLTMWSLRVFCMRSDGGARELGGVGEIFTSCREE